ncbi:MAG: ABC transporter permease subunit [Alphaproteobacteria bacterium]|nr:ABC transporter permease subunit [Alphaproteobacteria bacterium]
MKRWFPPWPAIPLAVYLGVLLLGPLVALAVTSLWTADLFQVSRDPTLANYQLLLDRPLYAGLILKSLSLGLVVALVTVPLGFIAAYALVFAFPRSSGVLLGLFMVSMLSSYLVRIYAWKAILGPSGVINLALVSLGLIDEPLSFLLYGNFAVVVTLVHILLPLALLPIYAAMGNIEPQVLEASRDLGGGMLYTLTNVLIPLARPGLVAAFLFCFVLASADYVTPQLVGGSDGVMIGRVIADQFGFSGNAPLGAALAITLLAGFGGALAVFALLGNGVGRVARAASVLTRARRHCWRLRLPLLRAAMGAILVFLYAPLVIVVVVSFNTSTSGILPLKGLTFDWYDKLLRDAVFHEAIRASLVVAVAAVVGATSIGGPAAFMIARRRFVGRGALLALTFGPLVLPGIVIGVALLAALGSLGRQGGLWPTAIAHVLVCLPFVVMVLRARLKDFDRQVEDAGRDLGSSPARVLRTVTLPIMAPTIIGAAILVFGVSLDEFVVTNFIIGANATIPTMIWGMMRIGVTPTANALAALILVVSLVLVVLASWVARGRSGRALVGGLR